MSRPRWSAPNQWSALGRASVLAASVAMGSWVWSTLANTAVNTMTRIRNPPAAPSGFFLMKRPRGVERPRRPEAAGTASSSSATGLMAIADAGVEHAVEHVDEQVGEDDDDG